MNKPGTPQNYPTMLGMRAYACVDTHGPLSTIEVARLLGSKSPDRLRKLLEIGARKRRIDQVAPDLWDARRG